MQLSLIISNHLYKDLLRVLYDYYMENYMGIICLKPSFIAMCVIFNALKTNKLYSNYVIWL